MKQMQATVLVIDDDPQIRGALSKVLLEEGYLVRTAADPSEALARFEPGLVQIVLLDISLPGKSGWDVFERLSAVDALVPIIVITGRADQYRTAMAAGVGALMEKPLDVPLLLRTVRALLDEPPEARLKRMLGHQGLLRYSARRRRGSPRLNGASGGSA